MNINELPREVLEEILSYLTVKQKFKCERVCRHWQQAILPLINRLAFDRWEDTYECQHKNVVIKKDLMPVEYTMNDDIMNSIISKCAASLRSFKGFISKEVMATVAMHCNRLQCVDVELEDMESLKLLCDTYGKQLTCATFKVNTSTGIKPILSVCPNLTSLAIRCPRQQWTNQPDTDSNSLDLAHLTAKEADCVLSWDSLRNLVIESEISEEMLKDLLLFTNLGFVSLSLHYYRAESEIWKSLMHKWPGLRSLSLELYDENYADVSILPQNLEFLSLKIHGMEYYSYHDSEPIKFVTHLAKLKTLKFYQYHMECDHLVSLLGSILYRCPALEDLSLDRQKGSLQDTEMFCPVLFMANLQRLSISCDFIMNDSFMTLMMTDMPFFTSFGEVHTFRNEWMLPNNPEFWVALRNKALAHPDFEFHLVGLMKGVLYLHEPLPPNANLCLRNEATVNLCNGFANSLQWKQLTNEWSELNTLSIEIQDLNYSLSGLPRSVHSLSIKCSNEIDGDSSTALTFDTQLPNLGQLKIYQQNMTNQQLLETMHCIAKLCPKLITLCIDRGNEIEELVDEQIENVLQCKALEVLCVTAKFVVSDVSGAKLADELQNLRQFGCNNLHKLGITCGPQFLKALVAKTDKKNRVLLSGGPTCTEVLKRINLLKKPKALYIRSYEKIHSDERKGMEKLHSRNKDESEEIIDGIPSLFEV